MELKLEISGSSIGMPLTEAVNWMMDAEKFVKENNGAELLILLNTIWNHGFNTKIKITRYNKFKIKGE